jgi:radical SAM superfamily enzyme with C-terminal helix-hairpin-helix motif
MSKGVDNRLPKDVFVVNHGPRSLTVLPFPFKPRQASIAQWKSIPGIGSKRATRIRGTENLHSAADVSAALDAQLPEWLLQSMSFED